ncbi:MAG TPA: type IV pilus modification protein PilV [Usitatibacteraceae bacterium]
MQKGATIIEVLVTIVILAIGLLGLAGLQGQILFAELESYQRAQAVLLMNDMVDKITTNRAAAATYVTASALGTAYPTPSTPAAPATCPTAAGVAKDQCEWSNALIGASERKGTASAGGMVDARGCIQLIQAENAAAGVCTPGIYLVSVVWQGSNMTTAPSATCGQNYYGDDRYRRAIATRVSVGLPSCQ